VDLSLRGPNQGLGQDEENPRLGCTIEQKRVPRSSRLHRRESTRLELIVEAQHPAVGSVVASVTHEGQVKAKELYWLP
jgi:hypothetical protein